MATENTIKHQGAFGHESNDPVVRLPPCSVDAHEADCLCDVQIVSPVEIDDNIDPDRFWGMRAALNGGHSYDTDEDILNLLEALALAKDAAANMASFDRYDSKGVLRASMELRDQLLVFIGDGNSIVDAPRTFRTSWGNCLAAITKGVASTMWAWPERFWAQIEDYIFSHDEWCGYRALMREFNIERGPATALERLYKDAVKNESAPALAYARELYLKSPRAKTPWMKKKLAERGYTLTEDQLTQLRARLRESGLVPDRNITVAEWRQQQR